MAEVNTDGGAGRHSKRRAKKQSTRIDMTPMVDLAFLLLTFFVLTSTFSKPKAMELNFPAKPKDEKQNIKVNNALTLIMTENDELYYYYGEFYPLKNPKNQPPTVLTKTDFSFEGLHKLLLEKNKSTADEIDGLTKAYKNREMADTTYKRMVTEAKGNKAALTVLIKADDKATYKNVIDAIDELNICNIGKYAVVDMMPQEMELLKNALASEVKE
jgi:biopolymer transport protein ExbD